MSNKTPTSGALSLSAVKAALEIYDSGSISMSDPRFRAFAHHKTGSFSMSDFYGKEEFGAHIKAADDDNGQATGYYLSFWGENDTPEFGPYTMVAAYDSVADNGFLFTADGDQTQDIFNAIIINNNIFYQEDATTLQYDVSSDTTTWKWSGQSAGLVAGTIYQMNFLISDETAAAATLPLGQGTDWTLVFEDNFDDATLNLSKWQTAQWYLHGSAEADPVGVTNYDLSGGYLRLWPVNNGGTWVQRALTTDGIFSQSYGYWEIKCRIPVNQGVRCSFWLLNHQTSARPIVTIMEAHAGQSPVSGWGDNSGNAVNYAMAIQPSTDGTYLASKLYTDFGLAAINLSNADHVFGIKKTETDISFYLDGALVFTQSVTGPNVMTLAEYLNVSIDYNVGDNELQPEVGTTVQDASGAFLVEYVRAWSPGAQSVPTTGGTTPTGYVAPIGMTSDSFPYMTFREEFDSTALDTTKWGTTENGTTPTGGRTNTAIAGGAMQMWPQSPYTAGSTDWQATITSDGKFMQKYGFFEVRMKMPLGLAAEPSFSLKNHELTGSTPQYYVAFTQGGDVAQGVANSAYHPLMTIAKLVNASGATITSQLGSQNVDLSADWHTYGLDWGPGYFQFYYDGAALGSKVTYSSTTSDLRMYLLARLWLITTYGQGDTTNTPDGSGNTLYIDYIRAWARADGSTVTGGTMPALPYDQGGKNTGDTAPTVAPIIEFYGDSTVWGYKSGVGGQVVTPMPLSFAQQRTEYTVRNKGVNSTTSAMWLAGTNGVPDTWANLMAASDAGYVAIQLGVNDEFDMSTSTLTSNLTQMVTIARQNGKFPVLITPYIADFSGLAAYAQAVRDAGAQNNVPVFDLFAWSYNIVYSGTGNVRDYCPDGVHPSDQLYIDAGIKVANSWYSLIPSAGDSSGSTVYDTFFGMHLPDPTNQPWPSVNFKTVRLWDVSPGIAWKDIHTADGVFDWTSMDAVMDVVSQHGVDVIYTLGLPPSWCTSGADNVSNPSAAATSAFINALIARYHDRIKYWEVWNDPSSTTYWTGTTAQLVSIASTLASVAHNNFGVVLSPSPHTNPNTWLDGYFGAGGVADIVAFQSYKTATPEAVLTTVSDIKAAMASHSITAQIWDVKASWGIDTDPFGTSNTLKKQYLSRSLLLERDAGVARVLWYQYDGAWGQLQDPATDTLTSAGAGYQSMNAWVAGNNLQPYVQSGTVYKIAVTGANNFNGTAVWNTAGSSTFTVPGGMVRARDMAGNIVTVTAGNAFTISTEPIFFDNGPQVPISTNPFPNVPVGHPYTYTLTFQDEFDGSTLDATKWNTHIWWNAQTEEAVNNWQVSGGELHIWPVSPFNPRTIDTDGKFYQTYGFFEMEAKLPIGLGCWPAFWLYNHDDAVLRPEIDIIEAYSGGGVSSGWSDASLHPINYGATLHEQDGNTIAAYKLGDYLPTVDLSAGYHTYGVLWEPDGVTNFFDGQQLGPKMATDFFTYRMYILLDLYFGSASGTPSAAETPQGIGNSFSVRYVRAWKKN